MSRFLQFFLAAAAIVSITTTACTQTEQSPQTASIKDRSFSLEVSRNYEGASQNPPLGHPRPESPYVLTFEASSDDPVWTKKFAVRSGTVVTSRALVGQLTVLHSGGRRTIPLVGYFSWSIIYDVRATPRIVIREKLTRIRYLADNANHCEVGRTACSCTGLLFNVCTPAFADYRQQMEGMVALANYDAAEQLRDAGYRVTSIRD